MSLFIGIVGLPNVGKSTLFNALTRGKQADVQNYPFCTIDPNIGVVEVSDERLKKLADVSKSKKIIPAAIEFIDIAGLIKGASQGEGLGNKFLSHIKEADAIVQVVRAFSDSNIINTQGKVDPKDDAAIINIELALADLVTTEKRLKDLKNAASRRSGLTDKEALKQLEICERLCQALKRGEAARSLSMSDEEKKMIYDLNLLTLKPMLYAVNVDEQKAGLSEHGGAEIIDPDIPQIEVSAKLEAELADLSEQEAKDYLESLGVKETGLDRLITASYKLLGLITYFTSGEPETRAWTIKAGVKAPQAAGVIHTDFIKGFIKADVINWRDFADLGGWGRLKESGKTRLEGKEYLVQDGDVIYFHISPSAQSR